MPKLLTGHGGRVAEKLEEVLEMKNEILALTPQLGKVLGKPWGQVGEHTGGPAALGGKQVTTVRYSFTTPETCEPL